MFSLKKRKSSGRGRGRGKKTSGGGAKDVFGSLLSLPTSVRSVTMSERRIMNEFEKNEVELDEEVFELWISPDSKEKGKHDYLNGLHIAVTPHEGLWRGVRLVFQLVFPSDPPNNYPNKEPKVVLASGYKIYHPNINYDGNVCLGYRRQNPWKAAWGVKTVAFSILAVLLDPNPENPQDGCKEISTIMKDLRRFEQLVATSLRGGSLKIEGKTCPFPTVAGMQGLAKIPKGALKLFGTSLKEV